MLVGRDLRFFPKGWQAVFSLVILLSTCLLPVYAQTWQATQRLKPVPPTMITMTPTATVVTGAQTITSKPVVIFRLFGKIFFDYNGNGKQEGEEPPVADVTVALDGINRTATNSTGWFVIGDVSQGNHMIRPYPPKNFRYMCESAAEFRPVKEYYSVSVGNDTRKDIGLMEGFLTLPLEKGTIIRYNAFFDDDRAEGSIKDWQGGSNTVDNHEGTDFGMPVGTPVLAAAPGVVKYVDDWGPVGIFVIISHETYAEEGLSTLYAHLSSSKVKEGQVVKRGEMIGYSGEDKTKPGPHLHFELDIGYHGSPTRGTSYTPIDVFRAVWNPSSICYWTKDNDPQFPTVELPTPWAAIPTGLTDAPPAMAYFNERLYVAVKGRGSNAIYVNSMDAWSGWALQPGGTPSSPALAVSDLHLYMAVRGGDNRIYWRRMDSAGSWTGWSAVPTGSTDAAPAIEFFNSRLYVAVKGFGSNTIWLNSMDTGTFTWSGWLLQPGSTPNTPSLTSWTYLYMAVRGTNNRIYWRRMTPGGVWSSWAPVPTGSTDSSPSIAFLDNRLYCAVKGFGSNNVYLNSMDPVSLAWSGWSLQLGASPSPSALEASPTHLYQSARGTNDRIYWRRIV